MEKEQKPRRPRIGETRGSANYEGSSEKYEKVNYSRRKRFSEAWPDVADDYFRSRRDGVVDFRKAYYNRRICC